MKILLKLVLVLIVIVVGMIGTHLYPNTDILWVKIVSLAASLLIISPAAMWWVDYFDDLFENNNNYNMNNLETPHLSLEEINDQALTESWTPTSKLRFNRKRNDQSVMLQQKWISSKGNEKWEYIEVVESE